MTTPLPPVLCHTQDMDEQYTADQLKDYGAAEYKRGIEDAAKECESMAVTDAYDYNEVRHDCALEIRKLGEKS